MNINQKFNVWCVRRCLHLWKPPKKVLDWLDDPENKEKAQKALSVIPEEGILYINGINVEVAEAAMDVAWEVAAYAAWETPENIMIEPIADMVVEALSTTTDEIKFEFVATLNNEELKTNDSGWIDYVTAEIFTR